MRIHTIVWTTMTICGCSRIYLDGHELLWVSVRIVWPPDHASSFTHFGSPCHHMWTPWLLRWAPMSRHWHPRSLWTSMQCRGLTREFVHTHTQPWSSSVIRLVRPCTKHGQPSCANGNTANLVGTHLISVEAHEKFGASCVLLGYHVNILGTHAMRCGRVCDTCALPGAYTGAHMVRAWARVSTHMYGWARMYAHTRMWMRIYTHGHTRKNGNNPLPRG